MKTDRPSLFSSLFYFPPSHPATAFVSVLFSFIPIAASASASFICTCIPCISYAFTFLSSASAFRFPTFFVFQRFSVSSDLAMYIDANHHIR